MNNGKSTVYSLQNSKIKLRVDSNSNNFLCKRKENGQIDGQLVSLNMHAANDMKRSNGPSSLLGNSGGYFDECCFNYQW